MTAVSGQTGAISGFLTLATLTALFSWPIEPRMIRSSDGKVVGWMIPLVFLPKTGGMLSLILLLLLLMVVVVNSLMIVLHLVCCKSV